MVSNITWKHSGFDAQCFESSYDWQINQVVLSETAQYGQSRSPEWHRVKEHIMWVTNKNAKIIMNNLGPQQGCELDVSQNMNIVLLYNRYFTGQKLNIPFI